MVGNLIVEFFRSLQHYINKIISKINCVYLADYICPNQHEETRVDEDP